MKRTARGRSVGWLLGWFASVAVATSGGGCSFLFLHPPPPARDRIRGGGDVRCTTSVGLPLADTVVAGVHAVGSLFAMSQSPDGYRGTSLSKESDVGIQLAIFGIAAASATFGYSAISSCTEKKQEAALIREREMMQVRHRAITQPSATVLPAGPPSSIPEVDYPQPATPPPPNLEGLRLVSPQTPPTPPTTPTPATTTTPTTTTPTTTTPPPPSAR